MKIAIIGTGGVGGYFGAKLVQAGFHVSFLARGAHLETIQKNGLSIKSIHGDFQVHRLSATDKMAAIGKVDLIILGVKAWQIKEVRADLIQIMHADSIILPLQNGILAVDELKESIPSHHIIGGLCRIISKIESPGIIKHFGVTPTIIFGEMNKTISDRVQSIKTIFDQAGIKSKVSADIEVDLWKKFIPICVGGLLAVTQTTYGELRERKETRQMMLDLLQEIYDLSQKIGIQINNDFLEKTVSFIDTFPYHTTSSLTRDILAGKPSEIHYQNGAVVQLGEKYGVDTAINKFVYHSILPQEMKARQL